ncbi:MAG: hypothetical protein KIC47_08395 [Clostridium sp.]|nr:hypothetical protein [Clostridium sp.]MBS5950328.1 hypothetical protein [Clostridium sp.]
MRKLLIGMLITCSLGVVGCGRTNTETPPANNDATGMTDGTNPGTSNSNTPGTAAGTDIEKARRDAEDLYTDFRSRVENGVDKIDPTEWETYRTEFENKMNSMGNTIEDASLASTMEYMRNLFNEYDKSIRENTEIAKDKVEEMKNKIEESFKK